MVGFDPSFIHSDLMKSPDGIHISTYSMCTKFDILNHDGFLISRGCVSVKFWEFSVLAITENLDGLKH